MNNLKKNYLLRSIKILDLNDHSEKTSDVLINNGKIKLIKKRIEKKNFQGSKTKIFNCKNLVMCPGLVDMRVNINDASDENILNIQKVAAKSGIITLITLPNLNSTEPDI